MPHYFISDTHLRLDRPDRAERVARFVKGVASDDTLVIAGDLCDFWFASRETQTEAGTCPGLQSIADFRTRGGNLEMLLGNHDWWLHRFYEERLGVRICHEPLELEIGGLRVHITHGHRIEHRVHWKNFLESRMFFALFGALPGPIANYLLIRLDARNARSKHNYNQRLYRCYLRYVESRRDAADLFVFGHVHRRSDDVVGSNRLVVLGDWSERASYLVIDEQGVEFRCDD